MAVIIPHTTRAPGTILTAAIYNGDHQVHITNANSLNAAITGIEDVATVVGIVVSNGAASISGRTITGTAGEIDVTDGNGLAGPPTLDFPDNITLGAGKAFTTLPIKSTDTSATQGPSLTLYRDSASPAANDRIGAVLLDGEDTGGNQTTYAQIVGIILDPTNASEDGAVSIQNLVAGALSLGLIINNTATQARLGTTGANSLILMTNNTNQVIIDSAGNTTINGTLTVTG